MNEENEMSEISFIIPRPRFSEINRNSSISIDLNGEIPPIGEETKELKYIIDTICFVFKETKRKNVIVFNFFFFTKKMKMSNTKNNKRNKQVIQFISIISAF